MEPLVEQRRKSKISIRIRILSRARFIPVPLAPGQCHKVQHEYIERPTPLFCPLLWYLVTAVFSSKFCLLHAFLFFSQPTPAREGCIFRQDKTGADDKGSVGGSGAFNSEKGLVKNFHLHSIQGTQIERKKSPPPPTRSKPSGLCTEFRGSGALLKYYHSLTMVVLMHVFTY